jgi:GNAT superfamily N-acetyltransferase
MDDREWTENGFVVTTDRARFDDALVASFLANDSYWANDRTVEQERVAADNSRCYSVIELASGGQVGGARAVTDWVSFAWIADVFVLPEFQGHGLGKFLVRCITEDLAGVFRLFLGTRDAHNLYAQVGFVPAPRPERWMERVSVTPPQ